MKKLIAIIFFVGACAHTLSAQNKIHFELEEGEAVIRLQSLEDKGFIVVMSNSEKESYRYLYYGWDLKLKWELKGDDIFEGKGYVQRYFLTNSHSDEIFAEYNTTRLNKASFQSTKAREDDNIAVVVGAEGSVKKDFMKEKLFKTDTDYPCDFHVLINGKIYSGAYDNETKGVLKLDLYEYDPKTNTTQHYKTELVRNISDVKDEDHNMGTYIVAGNTDKSIFLAKKSITEEENAFVYTIYEIGLAGELLKTTELKGDIKKNFCYSMFYYNTSGSFDRSDDLQTDCEFYSKGLSGRIQRSGTTNEFSSDYTSTCRMAYHLTGIKYDSKNNFFYVYGLTDTEGKGKTANAYFVYKYDKEGNKLSGKEIAVPAAIKSSHSSNDWRRTKIELEVLNENTVKFYYFAMKSIVVMYTNGTETLAQTTITNPKRESWGADVELENYLYTARAYADSKFESAAADSYFNSNKAASREGLVWGVNYYNKKAVAVANKKNSLIEISVFE